MINSNNSNSKIESILSFSIPLEYKFNGIIHLPSAKLLVYIAL